MSSIRTFKIMRKYGKHETIPFWIVAEHEKQAWINHGQSLDRLNSRGGLSYIELYFVLTDSRYNGKTYDMTCPTQRDAYIVAEEEYRTKVQALIKDKLDAEFCRQ